MQLAFLFGKSFASHCLRFVFIEMASYEAGGSNVSSSSSLQKGTTSLESSRKAGNFRPIRQRQDVF